MIALAFRGIVIPLQPASFFGLEAKQSAVAQSEADIGAAITMSARSTVTSLCHETRVCALPFIAFTTSIVAMLDRAPATSCAPGHNSM